MTNDELKKKIIELLDEATGSWYEDENGMFAEGYSPEEGDNRFKAHIADVLIAARIGDVKEAEHRAEVAERALRRACEVNAICAEADVPNILSESSLYRFYLEQAEKELAEEGEDD